MTKKKDYKVRYWKGKKKYVCNYCYFDTFDEEKMKAHVREHYPQKKTERKSLPLYDRFGNIKYYQ